MCNSFSFSLFITLSTGIPVHLSTIAAISFAFISFLRSVPAISSCFFSSASKDGMIPYINSPALERLPSLCDCSNSIRALSRDSVSSCIFEIFAFSACHWLFKSAASELRLCNFRLISSKRCFDASVFSFFSASDSIFSCIT
ncbi:hypothetical protein ANAPH1_00077 [Anaplasma phagocytophilum]|nr:hypothetical protein ANAPH1_00077 [Anaplasma phagocytophilum]